MGTVDYRLLPAFVAQLRENTGPLEERLGRADVERLAQLAEGLRAAPERRAGSVALLPSRDG